MLRVIDVDYIRNYELLVTFSDGSKKIVNLEPYLTGEVFGELLDKEKFVQYGLTVLLLNGPMVPTLHRSFYMKLV